MIARSFIAGLVFAGFLVASADASPVLSPDRLDDASREGEASLGMGEFAWRAFIALNWPSLGEVADRGAPDRGRTLGDSGPRVWETFKSAPETFTVASPPTAWSEYAAQNPCGAGMGGKTIASNKPFAEFNQPSFATGSPANPLVAQNGEYVRYETHFNALEFATFAAKGWRQAQNLPDVAHPADLPIGSIAVKAAWRPLNGADTPAIRARYYVTQASIVDVAQSLAAHRIVCSTRDVALVGLHIVVKTKTRRQWIWSTFEHVDNVPPAGAGEPDAKDVGAPYGFFDPERAAKLWPPFGSVAIEPVNPANPPKLAPAPMQIVRQHPIDGTLMAANRAYWGLAGVKGTVWEHYMLVASQWPTSVAPPGPGNDGAYFPGGPAEARAEDESYRSVAKAQENLVNTTMESYFQDQPSSCMACHHAVSNQDGFDFVGTLAGLAASR